ncbi:YdaS family helix-turn-helix protein [Sphingomonas sp. CD22]|uniref:transcriptional regulator n=1 Tax=Sphingomonas sp. CD22 TaxID=3100214 RepID=UPI002AE02684|nr:YdaS family helix-turn-helix protein [Sphingomonas sp. CD22]MEA1083237.1 YdaS family helix-turn-helix protein [Sphingomonas sp. CD22]
MEKVAVQRAVDAAGGQAGLARAVGVSQPSVWHWLRKSHRVPAEYVIPVEAATGVSRHELRPDIYPVEAEPTSQAAA